MESIQCTKFDKHQLLTNIESRQEFLDEEKKKEKLKELTFPGNIESLAPQIWKNGLQLLAQIYEIRRDISINAESAHFRAGPWILVHQVYLETQLRRHVYFTLKASKCRETFETIRNIDVLSLFFLLFDQYNSVNSCTSFVKETPRPITFICNR